MKLFIAQSIDGFISGENDSLEHLNAFESSAYGYEDFLKSIDAIVVGRRTFDVIYPDHGWTYPPHLPGVVVTSRPLPQGVPSNVKGSVDINDIARRHPNAWVDGGGKTIRAFCERDCISEALIFTLPVLLGEGARLFPTDKPQQRQWKLAEVRQFDNDVVLHRYTM